MTAFSAAEPVLFPSATFVRIEVSLERPAPPFDRSKLKVQGDGRPFSTRAPSPHATLQSLDVQPLLFTVGVAKARKARLNEQIRVIMADYLGRSMLAERLVDHATTLSLLPQIAKTCTKLADQLSQLEAPVLYAFEENRWKPGDAEEVPRFETLPFVRKLRRLAHAVERTRASMKPNAQGRQRKLLVDSTVIKLVEVIEGAGLPVTLLNSGSGKSTAPKSSGREEDLLLSIFRHFDRHVDEPQIWGAVMRARSSAQDQCRQTGKRSCGAGHLTPRRTSI